MNPWTPNDIKGVNVSTDTKTVDAIVRSFISTIEPPIEVNYFQTKSIRGM